MIIAEPGFEILAETLLVGVRLRMSFAENKTGQLWAKLMPLRRDIDNIDGSELYSVEIYPDGFFDGFNPHTEFEKWAAVKVISEGAIPGELELLTIPEGLYAVFLHKGTAVAAPKTYRHILGTWLPTSGYALDQRPHFALMGDKYRNNDPESEEEFWIPVTDKATI